LFTVLVIREPGKAAKVALGASPAWSLFLTGWRGESAGWLCALEQRTAGTLAAFPGGYK